MLGIDEGCPIPESFHDFRLCYVEDNKAYFTSRNAKDEREEDWHQCGVEFKSPILRKEDSHKLYKVYFDLRDDAYIAADLELSPYEINRERIAPWLTVCPRDEERMDIWADYSLRDFVNTILRVDGMVYVPFWP